MTDEYEQYRIGQAEAWLAKVRKAVGYARALEESAASHLAMADGLKGIDYSRVSVSQSMYVDGIPDAVAAHLEAGESLAAVARSARDRVTEAARALDRMDDPTEATCLHLYYVDALESWEHVCVRMHYTYDGMMKLRRRAVLHAYDVMPHAEREPIHPAI
ncbi:MAG: hypothetical protein IKP01_02135 [Bacteroidales bacterium]|nr:hypothetical protein [Bacteroidales bacterium]